MYTYSGMFTWAWRGPGQCNYSEAPSMLGFSSATLSGRPRADSEHCRPPRDGSTVQYSTEQDPSIKTSVRKIPRFVQKTTTREINETGPAPLASACLTARSFRRRRVPTPDSARQTLGGRHIAEPTEPGSGSIFLREAVSRGTSKTEDVFFQLPHTLTFLLEHRIQWLVSGLNASNRSGFHATVVSEIHRTETHRARPTSVASGGLQNTLSNGPQKIIH